LGFAPGRKGGRGKSAEIFARCAVDHPAATWNALRVGYTDPDGDKPGSGVAVTLVRVKPGSAEPESLAAFDSNQTADPAAAYTETSLGFTHDWPDDGSSYYLEVHLTQTGKSPAPSVAALTLTHDDNLAAKSLNSAVPQAAAANCGHCQKANGTTVDCYIPTQRYTCTTRATLCSTTCQ